MTKEKLIEQFKPLVYPYMGSGMLSNELNQDVILRNSKECAVIANDHAEQESIAFAERLYDNYSKVESGQHKGKWFEKHGDMYDEIYFTTKQLYTLFINRNKT